jgi:MFS family permease
MRLPTELGRRIIFGVRLAKENNLSIIRRLLCVRGLRAFADGYVSLLLPVYLLSLGMTPFQVGALATATLVGSGALTVIVGLYAWKFDYRSLLIAASLIMCTTGLGFAFLQNFWPLVMVAIVGTLNPSNGDVSVFLPLEHAVLSINSNDQDRTHSFAHYSLVGALLAAVGAYAAAVPDLLVARLHVTTNLALQAMFLLYAALGLAAAAIYSTIPEERESTHRKPAPLKQSKAAVLKLACLFCIDSFGGGFVVQSMIAMWMFQKFQLSTLAAAGIFFWTGLFSAFSYLIAVRIAKKIGLVNTMVFTHLPSSLCLVAMPFAPDICWVIALLLVRGALSQMDVPTRSSYVMAIVPPEERAAAAALTSVPRSLAASAGPILAGYLLGRSNFGWPLIVAGVLKIIYDLLLLAMFRAVKPPEEEGTICGGTQSGTESNS